jgi:peptide/nickel transport system substrate-binding protein
MRNRTLTAAVVLAVALGTTACGRPSTGAGAGPAPSIRTQVSVLDPDAKGPAADVPGARRGGTVTVYAETTPETFDPTDTYYVDAQEIAKLLFRTPTQFTMRAGRPVLVPDLTDLGTVSPDQLTWTFTMRDGIRYEDGTAVGVDDLAYAIKRSFAHDVFSDGPTYQMAYFKDGDTYQGPYKDPGNFAGVSTPDGHTLVIHLRKPFPDLPLYLSFPLFTPIPRALDTRDAYKNHPLATGPYRFDTFTPGAELTLTRNDRWDPATDPARHQYPDGWDFKWGGDLVKNEQLVLDSNGSAASALDYESLDASLVPQLTGPRAAQLIKGDSPCTSVLNLDSRKIPLDVRQAVAKAYPADQLFLAEGENEYVAERASTIMPPSVAGFTRYPSLPDLTGTGHGDPAAARAMLRTAGKLGFELSWYYDNTKPGKQQLNQILTDALAAAGFTVKPIGVATPTFRQKTNDYTAPVNLGQGPSAWCSDWPTGSSWFPVLFQSHSIDDGTSWGMQTDTALDAEIDAVSVLPADQRARRWMALDQKIMGRYVVIPRFYNKLAVVAGTNLGGGEGDSTLAMPLLTNLFLKS